jgi:hypothetical protein
MTFLLPGERIDGTPAESAHLRLLLTCFCQRVAAVVADYIEQAHGSFRKCKRR